MHLSDVGDDLEDGLTDELRVFASTQESYLTRIELEGSERELEEHQTWVREYILLLTSQTDPYKQLAYLRMYSLIRRQKLSIKNHNSYLYYPHPIMLVSNTAWIYLDVIMRQIEAEGSTAELCIGKAVNDKYYGVGRFISLDTDGKRSLWFLRDNLILEVYRGQQTQTSIRIENKTLSGQIPRFDESVYKD